MSIMTHAPKTHNRSTRNSRFTKLGATVAVATLALTACGDDSSNGSAETGDLDTEFLTIATGGSSGVYYQVGATFSDLLSDELGSDSTVQATGASAENINLLTDGGAELAITMGDANVQALEGTGPFEGEPRDGLMAVAALYPNTVQVVATASSGIETIEDLSGKNVAVGDVGSGVELNAQTILDAYDMSYDDINEDYLDYAEATDQMANGHIDAAFVTAGVPNPALTELSTNTDFNVLTIDGDAREKLLENDYFIETTIPGGTYQQEEDVETVGVVNHLMISSELSEDAAYDVTRVFFDNLDAIHNSNAAAEDISLEEATEGLTVPLHPGAARYLEENGVDVSGHVAGEED
ncbi:TAXI family TRAP transporter solute-binding subunit [Auritidibacter sp. NML100628]|uniref:TAXI family TRAP transporter solute-binding subunit n=1 Tax=Auritidibacter sp. NML100628 TaxID=2170742 RepID=UPI0018F12353|nr:TAXI family TRAP transporter solute-binding subunit [Auritidibacter sp. NML100628]